jgi:predicted NUDIX family NTP pyrophosphohydrolase
MTEETGVTPREPYLPLGSIRQRGGKEVVAWAFRGDCDAAAIRSNTFTMEWPPRSGRQQKFPEVDRAGWFGIEAARTKILAAQAEFLDRLVAALGSGA